MRVGFARFDASIDASAGHRPRNAVARRAYTWDIVSTDRADIPEEQSLEIPVEEALRRARPLPPYPEMVIEDLTEEEGQAFLDALKS